MAGRVVGLSQWPSALGGKVCSDGIAEWKAGCFGANDVFRSGKGSVAGSKSVMRCTERLVKAVDLKPCIFESRIGRCPGCTFDRMPPFEAKG